MSVTSNIASILITKNKFHPKSTSTEAQQARVLEMLRKGTQSTFDFRKAGVLNPSMRINEINKKAQVHISRVALKSVIDEDGFIHPRIAFYSLTKDTSEVSDES